MPGIEDVAERYRRHADAFERKVEAVRPDQWTNPSPCAAWTALDVVGHIVDMHGVMLRPVGRALTDQAPVADAPLRVFRSARADVEALLDDPAMASKECATPAGTMTVAHQIDQVVSDDLVLHGWDLARSSSQDDTIYPADVERLWAAQLAIPPEVMEKYRTPGAFGPGIEVYGPEVAVPSDAPLQDRLLGFIGRDPNWTPNLT